ncbi:MAG: acylneuraminate cytidylyltransferase family protein [Gammaproteobacteria bacterium]|nr:MAG: acylneuraminate cytidylyltransferase family protein [Gammaproteobacteria bacterium]
MNESSCRTVALIPARAGSSRVKDKNIRSLGGHPLIAYTISAARESGVFDDIIVSTDSQHYVDVAQHYGAEAPFLRPAELAGKVSPDIEWLSYTLNRLRESDREYDCFSILRPTSPFRLADTIRRAWSEFQSQQGIDSLRAVEKCQQHPGKMWVVQGRRMVPLLPLQVTGQPWHSSQYQSLPVVYTQNASLEIAWTRVVTETGSIAGNVLVPFFTQGHEGFDINSEYDWSLAEHLVNSGQASLPSVTSFPYLREAQQEQC